MIAISKTNNTGKLLVAVVAMLLIVVGCAVAMGDEVSAEGETATYDSQNYTLDDAIAAAQDDATAEDPAEITLTAASVISATDDGDPVDLTNIVIKCGTFGITTNASITGGTITATVNNSSANTAVIVGGNYLSITGTVFELTASTDGNCMPFAINANNYDFSVSGCTFTTDSELLYGAIHVQQGNGTLKVSGCDFGNGMILNKNTKLELSDTGAVILNFVNVQDGTATISEIVTLNDTEGTENPTTVAKTVLGWVKATTGNAEYDDSTYGGVANIDVDVDFDLGEVSKGDADNETTASGNITVSNEATATAYGGTGLNIDVESGSTLAAAADQSIAANVQVAGTATGNFTGTVTVTDADADVSEVTGSTPEYSEDLGFNAITDVEQDASGDGWTWVASTRTLTLDGYDGNKYFDFGSAGGIVTINLEGENTFHITSETIGTVSGFAVFKAESSLVINGTGTLVIEIDEGVTQQVYTAYTTFNITVNDDRDFGDCGLYATQNVNIDANVTADATAGTLVVNADGTLIADEITIGGSSVNGIVIVNDTLTYSGSNPLIVSGAIPVDVAAGYIYLNGADVEGNTANVSKIPVTGETVTGAIANTVDDANEKMAAQPDNDKNVTIIATADFNATGLTEAGTYAIGQTVTGSITAEGVSISAPGFNAEFNGVDIQIGEAIVQVTADGSVITGSDISGTISAETENETTTIASGSTIEGLNVNGVDTPIVLTGVIATSDVVITAGSVIMTGDIQLDGENAGIVDGSSVSSEAELVFGDAEITGTGTVAVKNLTVNGTLTIGEDVTIEVRAGSTMTVNGTVDGDGKIVLRDAAGEDPAGKLTINQDGVVNVDVESPEVGVIVTSEEEFRAALEYADTITLGQSFTLDDDYDYEVRNVVIEMGGFSITVGSQSNEYGTSLIFVNSEVNSDPLESQISVVNGEVEIANSDVYAVIVADENNGTITVSQPKTMDVTGQTVGNLGNVGYGNILNVAGDFTMANRNTVEVYGTMNVTGSLNVTENATVTVYGAGTLNVTGTVVDAGTVLVYGEAEVSGTMTVTGTLAVVDTVTTDEDGNAVTIPNHDFVVTGTLSVTGALSGAVENKGTVTFNGTSGATINGTVYEDAEICMYDGSTMTITSVEGTMTVDDDNAASDVKGTSAGKVQEGNSVKLTNVENVTFSVSVSSVGTGSTRMYTSVLSVSGEVDAVDTNGGSVSISASTAPAYETRDGTIVYAYVSVADTLTLGENVDLRFDAGITQVSGTINAVAENTSVSIDSDAVLTVTGQVVVGGEAESHEIGGEGTINATYYVIRTTGTNSTTTGYYTSFDAAIAVIGDAVDDTIYVKGTQTMTGQPTVGNNQVVVIEAEAKLEVSYEATLTVANGGSVSNAGTIDVGGTLTFENFTTGYVSQRNASIDADVLMRNDPARTYMSLQTAIDSGAETITLNQDIVIEEDLTIPEGVTVVSDQYSVTVMDDVTLTVAGGLELTGRISTGAADKLILTEGQEGTDENEATDDAELVVTGHVYYTYTEDETSENLDVAGAHYNATIDRVNVWVISSVEYAAENCHDGEIIITGQISVGDLEFTADEDSIVYITVENLYENNVLVANSALSASSITLGTDAVLDLYSGTVTATVIVAYGDGTTDAEIDLNRATSVTIGAATVENNDTGEDDYYAVLKGAPTGNITISSGTVTTTFLYITDIYGTGENTSSNRVSFTVASGATLQYLNEFTDQYSTFTTVGNDGVVFTVDGTFDVVGTTVILGGAVINGTMNVVNDDNTPGIVNARDLTVTGTVNVSDDNDGNVINVNTDGILTVGVKPAQLGTVAGSGSVSGAISVTGTGYVKAYPGSDLSSAMIDADPISGESLAAVTEFVINDTVYMTLYSDEFSTEKIVNILQAERFSLLGLNVGLNYDGITNSNGDYVDTGLYNIGNWYSDAGMADNTALNANDELTEYETVYAYAAPADVVGVVSVGTGITLYIDGVPVDSSAQFALGVGTHTVSYDIRSGYNGDNVTLTFNGSAVTGGSVTITNEMTTFNLTVSGATPSSGSVVIDNGGDDMSLTDILLIVLVILIVVMAIIVALRLMRS